LKVYLDPPYEVVDPFGRIPNSPAPVAEPAATDSPPQEPPPTPDPPSTQPRAIPQPKVLEFNPDTGRLEERPLQPVEAGVEEESGAGRAPPPAESHGPSSSPFRGLGRWDSSN
jgi:hypothetical protein